MADDEHPLVKKCTSRKQPRFRSFPTTKSPPRSSRGSRARSSSQPRPAGRLRRPVGLRRGRGFPARRAAVHDVRRRDGGRPPARRRRYASRLAGRGARTLRGRRQLPVAPRNRRMRVICEVPDADPTVPSLTGGLPRHRLPRARDLRPVRHHVRRSSRSHAHPHARRLGRPPAPQGRSAPPACR